MTPAEQLWSLLPLELGAYRHVFRRLSGRRVDGTWVSGPDELARFIALYQDFNLYVQLNPSRSPGALRPASADVAYLQAVLIDVDPVGDDPHPLAAGVAAQEALWELGVPGKCITVLFTGRGVQLWLHHEHIYPPLDEPHRRVRALVTTVARELGECFGCRIDTTSSDLVRLARLPGSINQKTGRAAEILAHGVPGPWLHRIEPEPPPAPPEPIDFDPIEGWPHLAARLSTSARDFLMFGKREPGRHSRCFHTLKALQEAGVDRQAAFNLISLGMSRCTPALEHDADFDRTFRQVFDA